MRQFYILIFFLSSILTYGQLSENFDASTDLPAGWATFTGTNGLGTGFNWETSTARNYSADNSAFVRYEAVTGGLAEDWLVTPMIDLTDYTGSSLSFYGGQQYTTDYGTAYYVRISTASQTTIADFTDTVATYSEADFTDITVPELTDMKTIDLSAYDGDQIYIAFVMEQNDGDNWFIDDVNVTGTLSTASFSVESFSMYPNPTKGVLNIDSNAQIALIEVYNILGDLVKTAENSNKVDLSDLSVGPYFARISSDDGKVLMKKIMKN
jgi:hypothetical protein